MILTIMAQNLFHGGFSNNQGKAEDRWSEFLERTKQTPAPIDLLLLSEAVEWDKNGYRQLARAAHDLNMNAMPLAPSKSGYHTALLYRQETVGRWLYWDTSYYQETVHGFGVAGFDIGLPRPLAVIPAHLDPFSPDKAVQEAKLLATRGYRHSPFVIIGGDCNYLPAEGPAPDFSKMRPYNLAARTTLESTRDNPVPERRIGKMFVKNDYVDVAYSRYEATSDEKYQQSTCHVGRIDQFWVTRPLQSAIVDYWLVDEPAQASDHKGIIFQLDTDKIDTSDVWDYS